MKSLILTTLIFILLAPILVIASEESASDIYQLFSRPPTINKDINLTENELAWIKNKNELIIGTLSINEAPFLMNNSANEVEGLTVDYLGLVNKNMGLPIKIKKINSNEDLQNSIKNNEFDIFIDLGFFENDNTQLMQSAHYLDNVPVIVYTENKLNVDNKERIAFSTNYISSDLLQSLYPSAILIPCKSTARAIEAIYFNKADKLYTNLISAQYLINYNNFSSLKIEYNDNQKTSRYQFYTNKKNMELLSIINKSISHVSRYEIDAMRQRWSGGRTLYSRDPPLLLTKEEDLYIEEHPIITLGLIPNAEPFIFETSRGNIDGIVINLLKRITEKTGLTFEYKQYPSLYSMIENLKDGDIDASPIITPTKERESYFLFTRPYLISSYVFLTKENTTFFLLEPSSKLTVALLKGHASTNFIKKRHPNIKIKTFDTMEECFDAVINNKADGTVTDLITAQYVTNNKYKNILKTHLSFLTSNSKFSFSVSKNNPLLNSILNKVIVSLNPDELASKPSAWIEQYNRDILKKDYYWLLVKAITTLSIIAFFFYLRNRRLQKKIQERQHLLEQVKVAQLNAEYANQAKTIFLSNMSHEIRTPLHAIIGALELAQIHTKHNRSNAEEVNIAYSAADSLTLLIGDILDIAKIEAGKLDIHYTEISLLPEIINIHKLFLFRAKQKMLALNLEYTTNLEELNVIIDVVKLKQIIANLLSNALKFTETGEVKLTVNLTTHSSRKYELSIKVSDTGIGISKSDLASLMEPFTQVKSTYDTEWRGTGLGLSICKMIIELMQGCINIESEQGVGTIVEVLLPVDTNKNLCKIKSEEMLDFQRKNLSTLKILLVDDNTVNRMLLDRQLTHLFHSVLQAENGKEALELLRINTIDIIITDCNMPIMNGYQLAMNIRASEQWKEIPILGLTASAEQNQYELCLRSGMNNCLFKPIAIPELDTALRPFQKLYPQLYSDSKLIKICGEDKSFRKLLLEQLYSDNNDEIINLNTALSSKEHKEAIKIAHKIKGSASLIGADDVIMSCILLEKSNAENFIETVTNLIEDMMKLNDFILSNIERK